MQGIHFQIAMCDISLRVGSTHANNIGRLGATVNPTPKGQQTTSRPLHAHVACMLWHDHMFTVVVPAPLLDTAQKLHLLIAQAQATTPSTTWRALRTVVRLLCTFSSRQPSTVYASSWLLCILYCDVSKRTWAECLAHS
jgi:hypothetical protein